MSNADQVARVRKYIGQLKDEAKLAHALSRLDRIDMSVTLLTETGVGKEVNRLRNHPECGDKAQRIVEKWRKIARDQTGTDQNTSNGYSEGENSKKRSIKHMEEFNGQQMSFADALNAAEAPVEKKKFKILMRESGSPGPSESTFGSYLKMETASEMSKDYNEKAEDVDPAVFSIRKGKPMKVYAGRKQTKSVKMDSLYNLAMTVCLQNIDIFTHSPLPTVCSVFYPVLSRCSPEQLERIEYHNPTFEEDTDELWKIICLKAFPSSPKTKDSDETWKECYKRNIEERERKLQLISNKIKKETKIEAQKVTQLSDAITPGYVRRRQINNGTVIAAGKVPNALEISKARKQIYFNGNKSAVESLPSAIRNGGGSSKSRGPAPVPQRKPALMQKTLKMAMSRSRR
ncbi:hypothetical protein FO519_003336 [Halicephalobus sp. NKZ332]|nr:hypothetical protein FO519_003336 [Halicephalobus sp. NKZ332]